MIGYIDPGLPNTEQQAAKAQLEKDILADVNYVEISIRSTTTRTLAPHDVVCTTSMVCCWWMIGSFFCARRQGVSGEVPVAGIRGGCPGSC